MKAVTKELHRLRRAGRPQAVVPPMPWAARASCRGHDPAQWMDDEPGRPTATAKTNCAACPMRVACLAHRAALQGASGVWGGLTTRERVAHSLGRSVNDDRGDGTSRTAGRPHR
jgi:WhiB family redox-sensing transcriptional regulator